jgi:DNA-binding GntR family transcriptional regulator
MPGEGASPPVERARSAGVYKELRRRLLLGEYPLVERLTEVGLAEQLGTSRTPIREALLRLDAEALVERRPGGGFYPRSPNLVGVRHLYELRSILELQAILLPRSHGQVHDLAALEAIRSDWLAMAEENPDPDPEFVMVDESFHVGLAEAAGNPAIADHLNQVNERIRVVRMQNFVHAERIRVTAVQHLSILDALIRGDPDAAAKRMQAHLDEAMGQASARAAQALERMMTAGALLGLRTGSAS